MYFDFFKVLTKSLHIPVSTNYAKVGQIKFALFHNDVTSTIGVRLAVLLVSAIHYAFSLFHIIVVIIELNTQLTEIYKTTK